MKFTHAHIIFFFAGALNCQFMGKSEQSITCVRRREHKCPAPSHLRQIVSFNPRNPAERRLGCGQWAVDDSLK